MDTGEVSQSTEHAQTDTGDVRQSVEHAQTPNMDTGEVRRSAEHVEASAKAAGLTQPCGPVQLLYFSPQLNSEEIKLLEIPHEVLSELRSGQK